MNFEKLRNYNTVVLSLFLTICLLGLIVLLFESNWTGRRSSLFEGRSREREVPEPLPALLAFPSSPMLLDENNSLFLMPQVSIPQQIEVDVDTIALFNLLTDDNEVNTCMMEHLAKQKNLLDNLTLFNGKTAVTYNILPAGLLAHSLILIKSMSENWLCFLARPEKGLPHDDVYLYSLSTGKLHRIGNPGYCPVELHLWKNQSPWILKMGKDLNKDGFINSETEPQEWMHYDAETQKLLSFM